MKNSQKPVISVSNAGSSGMRILAFIDRLRATGDLLTKFDEALRIATVEGVAV